MCGIVGVISKHNNGFFQPHLNAFGDLLYMDVLRGPDSTGVFMVDRDGNVDMFKRAGPAWEMFAEKHYDEVVEKKGYKEGKVVVGHNRKATVGKVNAQNAHPFTVNNEFVLVHNGSLASHKHLGHEAEVDSHAIAQYLHDKWKDDATPEEKAEVLAHIGGAWALVWYDVRTNKLNIVRNSQRPLALVETTSCYFFASEKPMLEAGLSRNTISIDSVIEVKPYVVYSFNLEASPTKVEEVVLPHAPFCPPVTTHKVKRGGTTKVTSGADDEDGGLSKNQFKKFLKNIVGRTISFYVEDFVEISPQNVTDYYFYGASHTYQFNHEIVGVTDTSLATKVLDNYMCAVGKVVEADYIKSQRLVKIRVELTGVQQLETTATH